MQATSFVESYIDAWNHCDPKGVADHFAENGIYCDIPENRQRSPEELITSLSEFFARDRRQYEVIGDILTGRNSIAFQYRVSPLDDIEGDGTTGGYSGAEFMTLSGDSAVIVTDYYDIPGVVRPVKPASGDAESLLKQKYAKSGLNSAQLDGFKRRLAAMMRSEKVFLQSDLTLPMLANAVGCSVNHLSQVINAGFGVSFFDYLNQHRVEYAKSLLGEFSGHKNAILSVAFAVGFNSNSAFYAAFKKYVGHTPAQYRRSRLKKSH